MLAPQCRFRRATWPRTVQLRRWRGRLGPSFASARTLAVRGLNGRTTPGHDRAKHGQRNGAQTKRHESGPRFAGQVHSAPQSVGMMIAQV